MKRKGKVIVIGGNEDKGMPAGERRSVQQEEFLKDSNLKRIIDESAHKEKSRILIIPTASTEPESTGGAYVDAFRMLKAPNVYVPVFFFSSRRRHTSFSRDWSSDVCSSD